MKTAAVVTVAIVAVLNEAVTAVFVSRLTIAVTTVPITVLATAVLAAVFETALAASASALVDAVTAAIEVYKMIYSKNSIIWNVQLFHFDVIQKCWSKLKLSPGNLKEVKLFEFW
jgi:hypothetical protein